MYIILKPKIKAITNNETTLSIQDQKNIYSFTISNDISDKVKYLLNNGLDTKYVKSKKLLKTVLALNKYVPNFFVSLLNKRDFFYIKYIRSLFENIPNVETSSSILFDNLSSTNIYIYNDNDFKESSNHKIINISDESELYNLYNNDILLLHSQQLSNLCEKIQSIKSKIVFYSENNVGPVVLPEVHLCKKCLYKQQTKLLSQQSTQTFQVQELNNTLIDNILSHIASKIYLDTYEYIPIPFSMVWSINSFKLNIDTTSIYKQCQCPIQEVNHDQY